MFDGSKDGKPTYRQWSKILMHFLEYHIDTWRRDRDMIMTVGSFMKDTARDWFDARDEQMRTLRVRDNYKSFISAMDLRFKHDKEAQTAVRTLRTVKYSGDVLKYLDTLQQLNMKVGMSGVSWRELIKEGLPDFILDLLPLTQGGEPQEDDLLILAIKEHGLSYERRQSEKKQAGSTATASTSGTAGRKRKRGGAGNTAAPANVESSGPPAKKQLTAGGTAFTPGGDKGAAPRFTKDQQDEALKGIPHNLREARNKKKLYTRCGFSNHRWQWCRKEISLSSTRKTTKKAKGTTSDTATAVATVSATKKKCPKHTVGPGVSSVSMQECILANLRFKAGATEQPRVSASTSSGKVFE